MKYKQGKKEGKKKKNVKKRKEEKNPLPIRLQCF